MFPYCAQVPDMIVLVIAALALMGGTTWLALQQSIVGNPALNRRLTGLGLALCLAVGLALVVTALVAVA